ncbi:MAG: hypothetical protein RJQ14_04410 [Marinoscillum sp.]
MSEISELSTRGSDAIEMCRAEYTKITGEALPSDIDRVYVFAGKHKFGLMFTRGEMGTFGERSKNYKGMVSCYVFLHPNMHVQDVREGYNILKRSETPIDETAFYKEHIDELLFLRDGLHFTFRDMQVFSVDRINAL